MTTSIRSHMHSIHNRVTKFNHNLCALDANDWTQLHLTWLLPLHWTLCIDAVESSVLNVTAFPVSRHESINHELIQGSKTCLMNMVSPGACQILLRLMLIWTDRNFCVWQLAFVSKYMYMYVTHVWSKLSSSRWHCQAFWPKKTVR